MIEIYVLYYRIIAILEQIAISCSVYLKLSDDCSHYKLALKGKMDQPVLLLLCNESIFSKDSYRQNEPSCHFVHSILITSGHDFNKKYIESIDGKKLYTA